MADNNKDLKSTVKIYAVYVLQVPDKSKHQEKISNYEGSSVCGIEVIFTVKVMLVYSYNGYL